MNKFLTTKKKIFSSLIQNYRIYMFDFRNNRAHRTSSLSLERLSDLKILREENSLSTETWVDGIATASAATSLRLSGYFLMI